MKSISRAGRAALAVSILALTLGFAASLWTSSDAEAADQPSPVSSASMIDADYCTPFTPGYFNSGIYAYNTFFYPYQSYGGYSCSIYNCPGPLVNWQYQLVCPGPPATIEMP